jgi:acyl carrier protein
MPELSHLEIELRDKIIQRLNLTAIDLGTINGDTPLFKEGLGLDSLDALEIGILIEEDYGIVIGQHERNRTVFGTVANLAQFVAANLNRDAARL